jgi:hypothetical protein
MNMKKHLAAVALAAALVQPAAAITFPSLTTIYVGSGVSSIGLDSGTTLHCSNVSGVTVNLRLLFLDNGGAVLGIHTFNLPHGGTYTVSTQDADSFIENFSFNPGITAAHGVVNIESTNSGVFCNARVVHPNVAGANGVVLPLVRVNPHPGTVE